MFEIEYKSSSVVMQLSAELLAALPIILQAYAYFDDKLTITSGRDGAHMANSLHYVGEAVDIRIWRLSKREQRLLVAALAVALGHDYDVVLEKTHIHIERDVK